MIREATRSVDGTRSQIDRQAISKDRPVVSNGRLLLILPLKVYRVHEKFFLDTQACNGLRLWLENFKCVTLAGPSEIVESAPEGTSLMDEKDGFCSRITVVPLPTVFQPHHFAVALPKAAALLKSHIVTSDYLHFALSGLWGDWAAVGCLIARHLDLPYAVWKDRVDYQEVEFNSRSKRGLRRLYSHATAKMMRPYQRFLIRRAALGLFNGMDCYDAYAKHSRNPHVVYDVHLGADNRISDQEVETRLSASRGPLRLVYAGRVHREKGVFDWIEVLALAARDQVDFVATWFGSGPELAAARERVKQLGLSAKISFPGSLGRSDLLRELRTADAFVFCHKLLESPRCLIEALMCGLPIIGYDSGYPRDLIRNGGGILTAAHDPREVACSIAAIQNPYKLRELSRNALMDGHRFTDEEVFRHRSILMKTIPARTIYSEVAVPSPPISSELS